MLESGPEVLDELTVRALSRGFSLHFAEVHPHAGGPAHYASYLEDPSGFEIELVAESGGSDAPRDAEADAAGASPAG